MLCLGTRKHNLNSSDTLSKICVFNYSKENNAQGKVSKTTGEKAEENGNKN